MHFPNLKSIFLFFLFLLPLCYLLRQRGEVGPGPRARPCAGAWAPGSGDPRLWGRGASGGRGHSTLCGHARQSRSATTARMAGLHATTAREAGPADRHAGTEKVGRQQRRDVRHGSARWSRVDDGRRRVRVDGGEDDGTEKLRFMAVESHGEGRRRGVASYSVENLSPRPGHRPGLEGL